MNYSELFALLHALIGEGGNVEDVSSLAKALLVFDVVCFVVVIVLLVRNLFL